jgi:sterol 3beta-glucosyltransferase/vancomycin aglycone glucosyltransferase
VLHGALFPVCSLVVHHGGAGTTHAALAAGATLFFS